jgi:hypothetical protein
LGQLNRGRPTLSPLAVPGEWLNGDASLGESGKKPEHPAALRPDGALPIRAA